MAQSSRQGPTLPEVLKTEKGTPLVSIGAYCLMPNHFHILLKAANPKEASLFMQKVATGYSMYFNKRNKRTGTLFEGKFKSRRVDTDTYFKRLLNYIHANPAELYESGWKQGIVKNEKELCTKLSNYHFSSLPEYLKIGRLESKIIEKDQVLDMLEAPYTLNTLLEEAQIFAQTEA